MKNRLLKKIRWKGCFMIKYKYRASLLFVFMSVLFTPTVGQADIVSVKDIRIEKISTKFFLQTTKTEQNHIKVANVCFITDSNDCRDDLFSKDDLGEEPGGSNPTIYLAKMI